MVCSVCLRGSDYGPFGDILVCEGCTRQIATIASGGDREIWSDSPGSASDGASSVEFEEILAKFKADVAGHIATEDGDSHANLAEAYRAMGLHDDAVREASTALGAGRRTPLVLSALEMLLSPPLLKSGGFARLRQRVLMSTDDI